jgi:Zn-finger protein
MFYGCDRYNFGIRIDKDFGGGITWNCADAHLIRGGRKEDHETVADGCTGLQIRHRGCLLVACEDSVRESFEMRRKRE